MQKNKNTAKAVNRNVRSSPRKINILLKNIRGKKVDVAIRDLSFARQRIAFEIKKTVQSAIANAENNNQYDIDNLYVKEAYVGKSIVIKEIKRVSKPGRRIYAKANSISKIQNGLGLAIVSTSMGIMSDNDARTKNIGGEIICRVF